MLFCGIIELLVGELPHLAASIQISLLLLFMSYVIEPMGIKSFLDDNTIKYPRFQRKAVWKKKQNFELCISVFQEYPIGVVILNKQQKITWLLDGRQRRTALAQMRENPVELYDWARTYIKFGRKAEPKEVAEAYWDVIDKYLEQDATADQEEEEEIPEEIEEEIADDDDDDLPLGEREEKSFNPRNQRMGLETLLDSILMVHPVTNKGSHWEQLFDYTKYFSKLRYAPQKNAGKVDPVLLRRFILDLSSALDQEYEEGWGAEQFIEYYEEQFDLQSEKLGKKFEQIVVSQWNDIKGSIETIKSVEKTFSDMRIGVVRLTNVSDLDAQNIFSRVNQGGTQLKAEELLSAKPYWNKAVEAVDQRTRTLIQDFYKKMSIPLPEGVVRWDLAATLVDRIEDHALFFAPTENGNTGDDIRMERIAMGFKILSAIYTKGISNKHVISLEKCENVEWEDGLQNLLVELNTVIDLVRDDDFFSYINAYQLPLSKLLGNAPAMEFIAIMLENWRELERPRTGKKVKVLQRNARALFDRLVFEYAVRAWRGSSDSKLAKDVDEWQQRVEAISGDDWRKLITESCYGMYNGQAVGYTNLRPILIYSLALKGICHHDANCSFDVDHIIPQSAFDANPGVKPELKDCLANLCILPRKENMKKRDKLLQTLKEEPWLGDQVEKFTGIPRGDFDQFSSVPAINALIDRRKPYFIEIFTELRNKILVAR